MPARQRLTALALACSVLALSACGDRDADDAQLAREEAVEPAAPAGQTPVATPAPGETTTAGTTTGALTDADRQFLQTVAQVNAKELRAAEIALERTENEEVRSYAQHIQRDHTQLGEKMRPLMQQAAIAEPPPPQLELPEGEGFDQAYMQQMVQDHQQALSAFEGAANGQQYSDAVRRAAADAMPGLRQHLQEAQRLVQQLGGEAGQGG